MPGPLFSDPASPALASPALPSPALPCYLMPSFLPPLCMQEGIPPQQPLPRSTDSRSGRTAVPVPGLSQVKGGGRLDLHCSGQANCPIKVGSRVIIWAGLTVSMSAEWPLLWRGRRPPLHAASEMADAKGGSTFSRLRALYMALVSHVCRSNRIP